MTTTTRIRRCGEAALLLDCADLAEAVALAERMERLRPEAVDVIAAARTVLVTTRDAAALPALRRKVEELLAERPPHPQDPLPAGAIRYPNPGSGSSSGVADSVSDSVAAAGAAAFAGAGVGAAAAGAGLGELTIDVRYDGPDLGDVADLAGISVEALVRRHTSITWRAAFGGFAPGFFYLVDERELAGGAVSGRAAGGGGADPRPAGSVPSDPSQPTALPVVPRLESPRARVPAGSVGLADRFCAVYPGASPGGWRLLGTTDAVLWDSDRTAPALLAPGMTVRFRDAAQ